MCGGRLTTLIKKVRQASPPFNNKKQMNVYKTTIDGVVIIEPHVFKDARSRLRNSSRVPRYQNSRKVGGFCSFSVKFFHIGKDLG